MSDKQRLDIFPTRMALTSLKARMKVRNMMWRSLRIGFKLIPVQGAKKGHDLLKKKSDALTIRFRAILSKIKEVCFPG